MDKPVSGEKKSGYVKNILIYVFVMSVLFLAFMLLATNNTVPIRDRMLMGSGIMIGLALMAALILFCIFLFFESRRLYLWYSLACSLFAFHTFMTGSGFIAVMRPDLNQHFARSLEYMSLTGFIIFIFLYLKSVFDLKNRKKHSVKYLLVLSVPAAFAVLGIADIVINQRYYWSVSLTQVGMMVFMFVNALLLILIFYRTETALSESREKEREIDETNKLLAQLNKLKSSFIADISHEMKTPLTVMDNYAQFTAMEIDMGTVSGETKANLKTISEEAKRLAQLVERLLDISVAKGADAIKVSVEDIISRAVALCAPILAANKNRMDVQIEKGCPPVAANPDMILQVFFNLVGNANRHTKEGTVKITARSAPDGSHEMVLFQVQDDGAGIPAHMRDSIFQRGISGDGSTGLGLAICKEAVETHGGVIEIASEQGNGTTITFTLPIYHEKGTNI